MAREGKLVLTNLEGIAFVPVPIDEIDVLLPDLSVTDAATLALLKGGVTPRLTADTSVSRIAEVAAAL